MILERVDEMTFKKRLRKVYKTFKELNRTPEEVMEECVNKKLDRSLEIYYKTIEDAISYLLTRKPLYMMKKIIREMENPNE